MNLDLNFNLYGKSSLILSSRFSYFLVAIFTFVSCVEEDKQDEIYYRGISIQWEECLVVGLDDSQGPFNDRISVRYVLKIKNQTEHPQEFIDKIGRFVFLNDKDTILLGNEYRSRKVILSPDSEESYITYFKLFKSSNDEELLSDLEKGTLFLVHDNNQYAQIFKSKKFRGINILTFDGRILKEIEK